MLSVGEEDALVSVGTVTCAPVPEWVLPQPIPKETDGPVTDGLRQVLLDAQTNLCGSEQADYIHSVKRIESRGGAERASHFVVDYNPAFQWLAVHRIRVIRDGESFEHARAGAFQTFRRETSLERLVLNGRITVSLLIPDIRDGDLLEVAVTFYGSNPALRGKFMAWAVFDSFDPWHEQHFRLVRPTNREVAFRAFNDPPVPDVTETGGVVVQHWHLTGLERRKAEPLSPPWQILVPALQFSECESWNAVATSFASSYDAPDLPADLAETLDRLFRPLPEPADCAAGWLHFVQQNIRYFSLSLGEGGLIPRQIGEIWQTRFGDCKDTARLYVAGARYLGLDACATLVSTTHGPVLDRFLPSPQLFNHCVVRLYLHGKSYLLDPTIREQAGDVENAAQTHFGFALPLLSDTTALERVGQDLPVHYFHSEDYLQFGRKLRSPARLNRVMEYYAWAADSVRGAIANEGLAKYKETMRADVRGTWPNAVETSAPDIQDDLVKNCLTVTMTYELQDPWAAGDASDSVAFRISDKLIAQDLQPLAETERATDIHLGRPRRITRRVLLRMPGSWPGIGWWHDFEMPGGSFTSRLKFQGCTVELWKTLEIDAWSTPASNLVAYRKLVEGAQQNQLIIRARKRFGRIYSPTSLLGAGKKRLLIRVGLPALLILSMLYSAIKR